MDNGHENYLWEESFGDEKGRPRAKATAPTEYSGGIDPSAILQEMLKNTPPLEPLPSEEEEGSPIKAPLLPYSGTMEKAEPAPRPTTGAVQSLLLLAEEAEKQAHLTADAAETANSLAQQLLAEMNMDENSAMRQLCLTSLKNAYLASEAAVQAQLSAMETHAAAVNQSLAELEKAKENLHLHSQDFIYLSQQTAQAQEEAATAREKSERARLEYATKQNTALNNRDALAQSKREYELKLEQTRCAQENLELAQKKARLAHHEYSQLKEKLEDRRNQWKNLRHLESPATAQPQVEKPIASPDPYLASTLTPTLEGETAEQNDRRQIAALVMPTTLPASDIAPAPFEPIPADNGQALARPALPEEREQSEGTNEGGKNKFLRIYGRLLLIALTMVLVLRLFVLDVVMVEGNSMQPTLQTSDSLISSKVSYLFNKPQRFDIILLDAPDSDQYYIKRVIGLPNEEIKFADGHVYINGIMLTEPFLENVPTDRGINTVIPDGYYFVMGDNRPDSRDSRLEEIGPIAEDHINGKVILRIFPLNKMKIL